MHIYYLVLIMLGGFLPIGVSQYFDNKRRIPVFEVGECVQSNSTEIETWEPEPTIYKIKQIGKYAYLIEGCEVGCWEMNLAFLHQKFYKVVECNERD